MYIVQGWFRCKHFFALIPVAAIHINVTLTLSECLQGWFSRGQVFVLDDLNTARVVIAGIDITVATFAVCWSKSFQRPTALCEKKYFLISLTHLIFFPALCLVSTIPLPFCRCRFAIPLCHAVVPLPLFRSVATIYCHCVWERNCWKRLSVCIGMKWPERWLFVRLQQNGKNRIRSYCYGTAVTAQWQVATATAQRNFLRRQRNSYGAYIGLILTEFT